ncbi:hypothetical protein [Kitasatospora sp. NPDC059571]|uniref:hypothetical protein n=1 Tax=Kitasatospora sp. NPDC059571 TaxID=3346871 RepID=UPI003689ADA8
MTPPTGDTPRRPQGEGPPPTYTPWLVVRAAPGDQGSRPLPAGAVYYACPDIAVAPADAWGRVQAGDTVTVSVTAQNLGHAAAPGVRAQFWWADPSAGLTPQQATFIGTSDRTPIAAGLAETLACTTPWTPQFVNGGHECLVVEVASLSDPLTSTFRPDLDRHVGQRNVTVLPPQGEPQRIVLTLANPFPEEVRTTLCVRTFQVTGFERIPGFGLPLAPADILLHVDDPVLAAPLAALGAEVSPREPGQGLQIGDTSADPDARSGGYPHTVLAELRERRAPGHDFGRPIAEADLPAAGVATVELTAPLGTTGGAALVHRLTQVTDDIDIGGYTLLSLTL